MTDFKLLEDLCRARGISGQEAAVRELIMDQVKPYADQITLDNLGNLLVFKQGAERPKTKLMLSAHMDEVGFIVTHVTENGFLKVAPVGGIDKRVVPGKRVLVGDQGIPGVIGIQPIHLSKSEEREKTLPFDQLAVDIGASSRENALDHIALGDMVTFASVFDFSGGMVKSKAIDDRAGCAMLIELLREELPFDLHFSFVTQEEVGCRGAKAAAYSVAPEACIVVESTTAADIAGVKEEKQVCRVGGGAVISFMDRSTIYDRGYFRLAQQVGIRAGAKVQIKQAVAGGNDAGAIHVSRGGVRTIAVSLPCRYLHSAVGLIAQEDYESAKTTVRALAEAIASGEAL